MSTTPGENCRTGCPTKSHRSYAECLKGTNFHVAAGEAHEQNKSWDNNLDAYRDARKQGIQPATTRKSDIDAAVALSRVVDRPFDATDRTFK